MDRRDVIHGRAHASRGGSVANGVDRNENRTTLPGERQLEVDRLPTKSVAKERLRTAQSAGRRSAWPHSRSACTPHNADWRAAAEYAGRARGERKRPRHGWDSLTPTEQQVVVLVTEGHTNAQIAAQLIMGRATVKTDLAHIFNKLGVTTRAQLAGEAARRTGQ